MAPSIMSISAFRTSDGTFGSARSAVSALLEVEPSRRSSSATAAPSEGPPPLTVNFSSAGSSDPEGQPLTYSWNFGDGATSTIANPSHTYSSAGPVSSAAHCFGRRQLHDLRAADRQRRQSASDYGLTTTPSNGGLFRAGDVISFSATATRRRRRRACRPAHTLGRSTSCTRATCIQVHLLSA